MAITLKQFNRDFITRINSELSNISSCEIPALNVVQGLFKQRIFTGGKDSDVNNIGVYRSNHIQARKKKGRQVRYKDLFFTGALARSIVIGTSRGSNVMGFTTDKSRLIAIGQEEQTGKEIFSISDGELTAMLKTYEKCVQAKLKPKIA